jgi:hypothetical protein
MLRALLVLAACSSSPAGSDGEGTTSSSTSTSTSTSTTASSTTAQMSSSAAAESGSEDATSGSSTSADASSTAPLPPCAEEEPCTDPSEDGMCRHELVLPDGMRIYYWANFPLPSECQAAIERVVIVQHGNGRTAWSYCDRVLEAAEIAGVAESTLVLAPWFPAAEDQPPGGFHVWDPGSSGWKSGDDSLTDPPLSSFAVVDHVVELLDGDTFPSLDEIVITGHSAGGQFTQRYAVATDVGASMRFVVLNPSSYLYLDPYRWDGESFTLPSGTDCDDTYDDFKYGLSNLPAGHYVTEHAAQIPDAYLARDVVYLLGDDDIYEDEDLDTSCPAQLQGEHRFERGLLFVDHLDARFPGHAHARVTVPGVGHSSGDMYTSDVGVSVLFGD